MKKLLFLLPILLIFSSCSPQRYSTQIFGYFDTVVTLDGFFESQEDFKNACDIVNETLSYYDLLFDIYSDGEAKRLNEERTLEADDELVRAIQFGALAEEITRGNCNIAMGSVLSLWHEARESDEPYLPDYSDLLSASEHTDIDDIEIMGNKITLTDERLSLDLGAIAKGFVSDVLRERLVGAGYDDLIVNLGGNVVVIGDKRGDGWRVGIQDPTNEGDVSKSVTVKNSNLVTSGTYQRYFEFGGKRYHHIISPDTLYPSDRYLSVSVLYENGAFADALSTALFNTSIEEGKEILESFEDIGVLWITMNNEKIAYGTLE